MNIDNVLSTPIDYFFIGAIKKCNKDLIIKSIEKESSDDKIGVFGLINNGLGVIEYSEIGEELSNKKDKNQKYYFRYGNINSFIFNMRHIKIFMDQYWSSQLYHIAYKKIKCNGNLIDGIKMELFIFDLFRYIDSYSIILVDKKKEFSPVKNKYGIDSPETAISDYINLYKN